MYSFFLDRDGVINVDNGYTHKVEQLQFCDKAIEGLKKLSKIGKLYIVTNQSGIGRGFYTEEQFHFFMRTMLRKLDEHDIKIHDYSYCPHKPALDGTPICKCRKPNPSMFEDLIKKYNINKETSFMIGDSVSDIIAAERAGIFQTCLLQSKTQVNVFSQVPTTLVCNDLLEFSRIINN